ncbi:MAG: methionine--tRNA ligase [Alphaproteobacteria bacterium]|nr:methionine--tRNA ligase [Alphaproteobacteria bacterium]
MTGATFYITTPIYYVNDSPHLGHAYTSVACDALARFKRLDGDRVLFLTGTDEHGQKVAKSARDAGVDPQAFCDRVSENFRTMTRLMNVSNDQFIRTTEPRHASASQAIWQAIAKSKSPKGRDNLYLGKYAGWYAVRDEAFYGEDELTTGPNGTKRAPSGAEVEWVEEPSYFFRLSDWQDWLLDHYTRNPDFIAPASRRNEVTSFVKGGLTDLSISRTSFSWGVPVPGDPKHVMYVWLDALTNYLTAVGYPETASADFKTFWPADIHVVGKDIVRFHCVYWPAFLAAAGLALPKRVFAHGWWTVEGQKMSKSLGNFIAPQHLVDQYGIDAVRYFMLRELPFGSDGDFSHRAVVGRINGDLANDFGNLAQRVLSFINKNCDGKIPTPGNFIDHDGSLLNMRAGLLPSVRQCIDTQELNHALEFIWTVVAEANRYVDSQAPWALKKSDPPRMDTVLYVLAETIRHLATLAQPFVPQAAAKLLDQLAVPDDFEHRCFKALAAHPLKPGTQLPKPVGVFPRYVETVAS